MTNEQRKQYIAALLTERGYCDQQGKTDRVEEIDLELARMGHEAKPPAKRAAKRVTSAKESRGRR